MTDFLRRTRGVAYLLVLSTNGRLEGGKEAGVDDLKEESFPAFYEWPKDTFSLRGKPMPAPEKWPTLLHEAVTAVSPTFLASPVKKRSFADLIGKSEPIVGMPVFGPR